MPPDIGMQLEGSIIENWEEIKSKVMGLQKVFPFVKVAGVGTFVLKMS